MDPGSRQIAVEEGRDGLAGLRDLLVVVAVAHTSGHPFIRPNKKTYTYTIR